MSQPPPGYGMLMQEIGGIFCSSSGCKYHTVVLFFALYLLFIKPNSIEWLKKFSLDKFNDISKQILFGYLVDLARPSLWYPAHVVFYYIYDILLQLWHLFCWCWCNNKAGVCVLFITIMTLIPPVSLCVVLM